MATEFNYLADKLHSNLGVNLNRQKYAPLDGSSVFNSIADFEYYIKKGAFDQELIETAPLSVGISNYVVNIMTQYPYVGQVVSIVDNATSSVSVYKITDVATCQYEQIDAATVYTTEATPTISSTIDENLKITSELVLSSIQPKHIDQTEVWCFDSNF